MRLSIDLETLVKRFGVLNALKLVKQAGFDGVDMPCYMQEFLGDNYVKFAKEVRSHLDELGLVCIQAHAPLGLTFETKFNESDPKFLSTVRAMESASIMGSKYIVVHAIGVPESEDVYEYNRNFYNSLIPYCRKFDIKVGVENLAVYNGFGNPWGERLGLPDKFSGFVKSLDERYFGGCIDLGHAALTYTSPLDFVRDTDGCVINLLHVQESDLTRDNHTIPFTGGYKWLEIVKALKEKGYAGDFSFEIFKYLHWFPDELIPEALRLAEKIGRYLINQFEKI